MEKSRYPGSKTSACIKLLTSCPSGVSCNDIIEWLEVEGFKNVNQSTTSGILSRLKREGAVRNDKGLWFLLRPAVSGGKTTVYDMIRWLTKYPATHELVVEYKWEEDTSYHEIDTLDEGFLPSDVVTIVAGDMISG